MKFPLVLLALLLTPVRSSIICFFLGTPRCFLGLGAVMRNGTPGEDSCEETCGFIFFAIFNFFQGYSCGGCDTLITGNRPNDPNSFHIDVFGIDIDNGDASAFVDSADRWEDVIVEDAGGPFSVNELNAVETANDLMAGCVYPNDGVDDLYICADIRPIDGSGGANGNILGAAAPSLFDKNNRPVTGFMFFDSFDVNRLQQEGTFDDVVLHEMGHVLGLGTAWIANGLQQSSSTCPYSGANANREYRSITGCNDSVDVEPASAGQGSGCSHWAEGSCLRNEIMSTFLSPNSALSRITIGSLQDIGYGVNYNQAENLNLAGSCCRRRGEEQEEPVPQRRRLLSDEATATAVAYGQQLLAMQPEATPRDSTFSYAGIVSVLMLEEGEIFGVMVTREGAI